MEGVISVLNEFARCLRLKISLEQLKLFRTGTSQNTSDEILLNFPFEVGSLLLGHLGLPLMTKGMKSHDYLPLLEKIRTRINTFSSHVFRRKTPAY